MESRFPAVRGDLLLDYHVLISTKRKKSVLVNFLPNTQIDFLRFQNTIIKK
ncbi:hypothetical protein Hanom_Chr16g01429921 [Helianthus anomalus]